MPNQKLPGCGFHHIAVWTADWDRSLDFYTQGLGFTQKIIWGEAPERGIMLDTGDGNYLEIFERAVAPTPSGEPHILHLCFRVESCEQALEVARAAGAEVTMEVTEPEAFKKLGLNAKIAFILGPDGEIIEFFECPQL